MIGVMNFRKKILDLCTSICTFFFYIYLHNFTSRIFCNIVHVPSVNSRGYIGDIEVIWLKERGLE